MEGGGWEKSGTFHLFYSVMTTDDAYEIEYDNGEDDDQQIYGEELLEDEAQMLQIDKESDYLTKIEKKFRKNMNRVQSSYNVVCVLCIRITYSLDS